jgi:hypothetical protein
MIDRRLVLARLFRFVALAGTCHSFVYVRIYSAFASEGVHGAQTSSNKRKNCTYVKYLTDSLARNSLDTASGRCPLCGEDISVSIKSVKLVEH